jgi:hypothetical protein
VRAHRGEIDGRAAAVAAAAHLGGFGLRPELIDARDLVDQQEFERRPLLRRQSAIRLLRHERPS